MIKKITKKWLKSIGACKDGKDWLLSQKETDPVKVIKKLMLKKTAKEIENRYSENSLEWAMWVITQLMTKMQCVKYVVFAAESVIEIFETKYPKDFRPRQAIEATKEYIKHPTEDNKIAADYATATAVADYAGAATAAVYAADYADYAAACACADACAAIVADACAVACAANYAVDYAVVAVNYAVDVVADYKERAQRKILKYGISLLDGGK